MNLPNKIDYKDEDGYGVMKLDLPTYVRVKARQIHEMLFDFQASLRKLEKPEKIEDLF